VIFAGGYDVNMILPRTLAFVEPYTHIRHEGKTALARLWTGDESGERFEIDGRYYWLGYRPRKLFTVSRQRDTRRFILDDRGQPRRNATKPMRLWDVWGFFQSSFVVALKTWFTKAELATLVPMLAEIEAMKKNRAQFADEDPARVREYCFAECRALVALMEKLGRCLAECDLHPQRWDGVGAIASTLLRKHGVKDAVADLPRPVYDAARVAYAGGRIEQVQLGVTPMDAIDIRSAYPSAEAELPDLRAPWIPRYDPIGFSLARVRFDFPRNAPWYPLFYRTLKGTILFPSLGEGIYWRPEIEAARAFAKVFGGTLTVTDAWTLDEDGRRPFGFLGELYERRFAWKKQKRAAQNILRLGPNAVYGKTAQRIGMGENDPPYFSLAWCGWITSATRAKLVLAALNEPHAIVSFSTDGIHSTRSLGVAIADPDDNTPAPFGTWEHKGAGDLVSAQAGVYWQYLKGAWVARYRGFSREGMEEPTRVLDAWGSDRWALDVHAERFTTLGAALHGDAAWESWKTWQRTPRLLDLTGKSAKRMGAPSSSAPHRSLVPLRPAWNITFDTLGIASAPYRRAATLSLDEDPSTVSA
jgi:hypothetical protein